MKKIGLVSILIVLALAAAGVITIQAIAGPSASQAQQSAADYVVLGWNNLGMHCYNPDFSNLAILPPYNTLIAQVIKLGDPPQIVTSGVTVEYSFPDNTYSAGDPNRSDKTNFWDFVNDLFGVSLPPDVGLTGKGLSGTMDKSIDGNYFIAEGIPLTDLRDQDVASRTPYPYQTALLTVRDSETQAVLATLTVVAPVSTELSCGNCHGDITQVATNPSPWLNVPNCGNPGCHGAAYAATVPLFQDAVGHGGIYCAGCHDSPHAIAASRETNDALKFVQLQDKPGTLRECTVCHTTLPTAMFTHMGAAAAAKPFKTFLPAVSS